MRKILVTGANGFLGSHLVKNLKNKFQVIGVVRNIRNISRLEGHSLKIYSSEEPLENIFNENELFAVIHTATAYKKKEDSIAPLLSTNILLPVRLAELCTFHNVNVFLNTDSFFNNSSYSYSYLSEYTLTKKHVLDWLKLLSKSGEFKLVNMKIFHMYGENDSESKFVPNLISDIRKDSKTIKMTKGEQTRDFIYIKDVVDAYIQVLHSIDRLMKFQEFDIGTGIDTSIKDFANLAKTILGSEVKISFGAIPYRDGEIMQSRAQNFDLHELGWKPTFSLERGLKEYLLK